MQGDRAGLERFWGTEFWGTELEVQACRCLFDMIE